MKISAVINTRNEEANIVGCLESLSWVDEIVVVDMESSDRTKELAYPFTKQVYNHPMVGFVEPARNFAIAHATGDWILIVDADERIPRTLAAALIDIAADKGVDFIRLPRKNIIFGSWMQHSRWWPDYNIRFFRRGKVEWQEALHSVPITDGHGINLEAKEELAIEHLHYTSVTQFLERLHRYTEIQSNQLIQDGYQFDWIDLIKKPTAEFLSRFFAGQGYLDGLHGLTLAVLQAFSEFIVFMKVWEKQGFKRVAGKNFQKSLIIQIASKSKEFSYWLTTLQIDTATKNSQKFLLRIKRKFF